MSLGSPQLTAEIETLVPALVRVRHDLHRHPELGFEERRTQGIVRAGSSSTATRRVRAQTGLVADLHAERAGGAATDRRCGPTSTACRSTSTPICRTGRVHAGRAHKCGHDGHTAILMGVAALLAEHRDAIAGNVRLLFQPAEEGVRGGGAPRDGGRGRARGRRRGLRPAQLARLPARAGAREAGRDDGADAHARTSTVTGVGGHGSQPQLCRDPIVAAARTSWSSLQTVVVARAGLRRRRGGQRLPVRGGRHRTT